MNRRGSTSATGRKRSGFGYCGEFWEDRGESARSLERIRNWVDRELAGLDMNDAHPMISRIARYSLTAGGKRVRPVMLILLGSALGVRSANLKRIAISTELAHTASLIIDDIMDESPMRRGRTTAHVEFGKTDALSAAHYLIFKSTQFILGINARSDVRYGCLSQLCRSSILMTDGQWCDLSPRYRAKTLSDYVSQIHKRSGQFFECGAVLCSRLAGKDRKIENILKGIGGKLGTMFQFRDDLLDYYGSGESLGKPAFQDFRSGRYTFPIFVAMSCSPEYRNIIIKTLRKPRKTVDDARLILWVLENSGAASECKLIIELYARDSKRKLRILPPCRETEIMSDLIDYLACRVA